MKSHFVEDAADGAGHSPQGECGLKSERVVADAEQVLSLPARGVRVEI